MLFEIMCAVPLNNIEFRHEFLNPNLLSNPTDESQPTSTLGAVQKMKADQKDPREDILRTIRLGSL